MCVELISLFIYLFNCHDQKELILKNKNLLNQKTLLVEKSGLGFSAKTV